MISVVLDVLYFFNFQFVFLLLFTVFFSLFICFSLVLSVHLGDSWRREMELIVFVIFYTFFSSWEGCQMVEGQLLGNCGGIVEGSGSRFLSWWQIFQRALEQGIDPGYFCMSLSGNLLDDWYNVVVERFHCKYSVCFKYSIKKQINK